MHQTIDLERKFRPEIEGLRIIAALLVAVYHIWLGRISGGVDVFFVISGFLITTSIVSRYNRTGQFQFIPYITNLMKRLLPSVVTVVFAVSIMSILFLPRSIIEKTFNESIASLLYYQNWQLALSNTDYLDREQMSTPLEHFWAMSIQGQFYIIWFVLFSMIFFVLKWKVHWSGIKLVNTFLTSLFIVSLAYSIYLTEVNQPWAYFDVGTRVWEFSLGGLLAVNLSRIRLSGIVGDIAGRFGLIGLLLTGIIFDVATMFPGYIALWPMLCAMFILLSGNLDTKYGVKKFLGSRWMMEAGSLAFGLYLWHGVLLSFYNYHNEGTPSLFAGILIIISSFILSLLMTRFIEAPVRSMKTVLKPLIIVLTGVVVNSIVVLGLYQYHQISIPSIDGEYITEEHPGALAVERNMDLESREPIPSFAQAKDDLAESYQDNINQSKSVGSLKIGEYGDLENHQYTVALVGSSYSAHFLGALQQFAEEENIKILNIIQVGSRFSTSHQTGPQKEWNSKVMTYLAEHKKDINLVVATADIGEADFPKPPKGMVEQLNRIGDDIGLPILAIRGNQRFGFNIVEHLEQYGYDATKDKMMSVEPVSDTPPWALVDYKSPNIHYVDYNEYFKVNGEYEPIIGNVLVYYDGGHINNTFSRTLGPILQKDVMRIIRDQS